LHDQRVGGHQPLDMGPVVGPVAHGIMVIAAPFGREYGIKAFGIEIKQVDRMPRLLQGGQRLLADRGMKAVVQRMAIDIQHAHPRAFYFNASSSREPVSTSLENAMASR
jgi:hypothetical protein